MGGRVGREREKKKRAGEVSKGTREGALLRTGWRRGASVSRRSLFFVPSFNQRRATLKLSSSALEKRRKVREERKEAATEECVKVDLNEANQLPRSNCAQRGLAFFLFLAKQASEFLFCRFSQQKLVYARTSLGLRANFLGKTGTGLRETGATML